MIDTFKIYERILDATAITDSNFDKVEERYNAIVKVCEDFNLGLIDIPSNDAGWGRPATAWDNRIAWIEDQGFDYYLFAPISLNIANHEDIPAMPDHHDDHINISFNCALAAEDVLFYNMKWNS